MTEITAALGHERYNWHTFGGARGVTLHHKGAPHTTLKAGMRYGMRHSSDGKSIHLITEHNGKNVIHKVSHDHAERLAGRSNPMRKPPAERSIAPKVKSTGPGHGAPQTYTGAKGERKAAMSGKKVAGTAPKFGAGHSAKLPINADKIHAEMVKRGHTLHHVDDRYSEYRHKGASHRGGGGKKKRSFGGSHDGTNLTVDRDHAAHKTKGYAVMPDQESGDHKYHKDMHSFKKHLDATGW